jgi:hypothetical protein
MADWDDEAAYSLKIGKKFKIRTSSIQVDTESLYEQTLVDTCGVETISLEDVVWLNEHDARNRQVSLAYLTVSPMSFGTFSPNFFSTETKHVATWLTRSAPLSLAFPKSRTVREWQ